MDVYFGGTEVQWKERGFSGRFPSNPTIHYGSSVSSNNVLLFSSRTVPGNGNLEASSAFEAGGEGLPAGLGQETIGEAPIAPSSGVIETLAIPGPVSTGCPQVAEDDGEKPPTDADREMKEGSAALKKEEDAEEETGAPEMEGE